MRFFLIFFLILVVQIYSNQLEEKISIEQVYIIKNLKNDPLLDQLKQEIKKNLKQDLNGKKIENLKIYKYKIQTNEDFYFIMAKSSLDHTTLLSLNKEMAQYKIEDFKSDREIYLANHRGFFSSKPISNSNFVVVEFQNNSTKKVLYFYPGEKKLELYYTSFLNLEKEQKENPKENEYIYPIKNGKISSSYGWRINPITNQKEFHFGIDIQTALHTPIFAPIDGKIIFAGYKKGYGNTMILYNKQTQEIFLFAHLSKFNKIKNQEVSKGDLIGYSGNTGFSTGPHLHIEYKKNYKFRNPLEIFPKYL